MKVNGTCPSLETIGAFVDGRFKDREREVIAEHVASCEACYFVFSETSRMKATSQTEFLPEREPVREPEPVRPTIPAWWRTAAAGLAAAATILLAVNMWESFGANGERRALDQLVAAVGTDRAFEPRLTGGFAYAPVRGPVRGTNNSASLTPDVRIAVAEIEKQYGDQPIAATAALIAGDAGRAVTILEAASQIKTSDARIFSDLSAAYLMRGDASAALTMANRALEIERLMPEAMFNRALALQQLNQVADAISAWQSYLTIDDRSGWSGEARARLRILSGQP